jgi:enoyl-CoA hydratase/carnithine racemase
LAVEFSSDGGVGIITLDNPPTNSYDLDDINELRVAVERAANDGGVKAVVVRSATEGFFSAGANVKRFQENSVEANMEMVELAHRTLDSIISVPKIFIAEIAGHALGGGLEIALACDLRFGADGDYRIGTPEVTLGVLPGNGGTQRLPRLIGWSRALDLMITGRMATPLEAHDLGILDRLLPAAELREQTRRYADAIVNGPTLAIGSIKRAVHEGVNGPLAAGLVLERNLVCELFASIDSREGIAAFVEKRQAHFVGR